MDTTKKVEMEEVTETIEVIDEPSKPKFGARLKAFFGKHKKKIIAGGLVAVGIIGGALVKARCDRLRDEEDEEESMQLAEDWFNGLETKNSIPEHAEESEESTEEV